MKKHRVWIFYLIADHDVYGTYPNEIYAYTTDLELAAMFSKQRDMNKFYMKKVKMDTGELNNLYKDYMDSSLVQLNSTTRKGEKMKAKSLDIALTRRESIACTNAASLYTNERLYETIVINPMVFKKDYLKALMTIRYLPLYELFKGIDIIHTNVHKHMHPDMLNIVLDNFGELFDEGSE